MKKNQPKYFCYSGYTVPVGFILRLKHKKHLDAFTIDRLIFWGVQYCDYKKTQDVEVTLIQAIQSGIDKRKGAWLFRLVSSEFESKNYIQGCIDREIYHRYTPKPKRGGFTPALDRKKLPDSIGTILKGLKL